MSDSTSTTRYIQSAKNKKLGLWLLIGPFVSLIILIFISSLVSYFVFPSSAVEGQISAVRVAFNLMTGLLGFICLMALIIGIPLGIVLLIKKELDPSSLFDERSGKGDQSDVPEQIKGWSWGAAGLGFIWGAYHNVWISLLAFIPLVNWFWWIVMGVNGNEWAWRKNRWESVEQFHATQAKWAVWGIAIFVLRILIIVGAMLSVIGKAP